MDSDIDALAQHLDEAAALLRKYENFHWADWLTTDARLIRNLYFYGITHLRSALGGMGSLNDVILAQPSPENRAVQIASQDDSRFQVLLGEIWALSRKLVDAER